MRRRRRRPVSPLSRVPDCALPDARSARCRCSPPSSSAAPAGTLLFVRVAETPGSTQPDFEIFRAGADGAGARNLTRFAAGSDFDPAISPDGRHIAFWRIARAGDDGADGVPAGLRWVTDVLDERNVTRGDTSVRLGPEWTPDGKLLVGGTRGIVRYRVDGTREGVVVSGGRSASVRY